MSRKKTIPRAGPPRARDLMPPGMAPRVPYRAPRLSEKLRRDQALNRHEKLLQIIIDNPGIPEIKLPPMLGLTRTPTRTHVTRLARRKLVYLMKSAQPIGKRQNHLTLVFPGVKPENAEETHWLDLRPATRYVLETLKDNPNVSLSQLSILTGLTKLRITKILQEARDSDRWKDHTRLLGKNGNAGNPDTLGGYGNSNR